MIGGDSGNAVCLPAGAAWHNTRSVRMGPDTTCGLYKGYDCSDRDLVILTKGEHIDDINSAYLKKYRWSTSIEAVKCYLTG
jgi:hypothetical protein